MDDPFSESHDIPEPTPELPAHLQPIAETAASPEYARAWNSFEAAANDLDLFVGNLTMEQEAEDFVWLLPDAFDIPAAMFERRAEGFRMHYLNQLADLLDFSSAVHHGSRRIDIMHLQDFSAAVQRLIDEFRSLFRPTA